MSDDMQPGSELDRLRGLPIVQSDFIEPGKFYAIADDNGETMEALYIKLGRKPTAVEYAIEFVNRGTGRIVAGRINP